MKYLKCEKCGNVVAMVKDSGVTPMCCGEEMKETECPEKIDENINCTK